MTRFPDWQVRLQSILTRFETVSFVDGESDCAMFTAACVEAMTGLDLAEEFRGYATQEEGFERLRAAGYADHFALVERYFTPTAHPRVGDIAVVHLTDDIEALGIVQGRGVYLMAEAGLAILPRNWISRGFVV